MKKIKFILIGVLSLLLLGNSNYVLSAEPSDTGLYALPEQSSNYEVWENKIASSPFSRNITYSVPLNKSQLVRLNRRVSNIIKGNPAIADILLFPPNKLFIRGRSLGTTNTIIRDTKNNISSIINIEVTHDLESLKEKLYLLLPNEVIHVNSVQKNIVLKGEVSGLDVMQAAIDIAQGYLGSSASRQLKSGGEGHQNQSESTGTKTAEKSKGDVPHVINLMSVGGAQQVMLEVTIAEIDRKLFRGLDVNFNTLRPSSQIAFGALNGGGSLNPLIVPGTSGAIDGPLSTFFAPSSHSIDAAGIFMSYISGSYIFNLTIDAAKNQQLAKILAEPVLTTLSGQEATFISGGEFPIPVPQSSGGGGNSSITIVFKEFGISMRFIPVVLDSGRINLSMHVGVSELSEDAAIFASSGGSSAVFSIPSLTKREASSTLELADGQTMSIAGLISDRLRSNVDKFPGLGDVPVLGALFRSEQFIKDRTELVFFVTPHLAKSILPKEVKLPTDSYVEPDDWDFYVLGRLDSRNAESIIEVDSLKLDNSKGGLEGRFGHQLTEEEKAL